MLIIYLQIINLDFSADMFAKAQDCDPYSQSCSPENSNPPIEACDPYSQSCSPEDIGNGELNTDDDPCYFGK